MYVCERSQMQLTGIPIEHGMEVEQSADIVPHEIRHNHSGKYMGEWHRDLSGPSELEAVGPSKHVGSLIKKFSNTMRQYDDEEPWTWHSELSNGSGCGSHAHITFADGGASEADKVTGMTIAWNTAVELTPFLAPFWCFNWKQGFRSSVSRWASPTLTRKSQDSVRNALSRNRSRNYESVTFNPATGSKPLTIELRLVENHPAFALVGLTFLRRTMTKCMRGGWSPKLAGDRRQKLNELYSAIYNARSHGGLIEAMQSVGPFTFEEGRGIPGSDKLEYETAWDVLQKIMAVNGIDRGAYDDHVKKLVQAAGNGTEIEVDFSGEHASGAMITVADGGTVSYSGSELGPQNNTRAMWHTFDSDFSWDVGPEVNPRY